MTRVDFHLNAPDKIGYACRLVRKIYRAGQKVVVVDADAGSRARFDQALWTFSPLDFIPHVDAADPLAAGTPVLLAGDGAETAHHDVMVNLGNTPPTHFSRFERLIEIVTTDDEDRHAARERWRFYRDRGYPIESFDLGPAAAGRGR